MKHFWQIATTCLAVSGCASPPHDGAAYLPQLDAPQQGAEEIYLTAAFSGTLTMVRGCVKVASDTTPGITTVIWHRGTELHQDRSGYFLRNSRTGAIYRVGQRIEFGGGEMPQKWTERQYPEVSKRCGPPYASGWLSK